MGTLSHVPQEFLRVYGAGLDTAAFAAGKIRVEQTGLCSSKTLSPSHGAIAIPAKLNFSFLGLLRATGVQVLAARMQGEKAF